jgi:hypothetical protein
VATALVAASSAALFAAAPSAALLAAAPSAAPFSATQTTSDMLAARDPAQAQPPVPDQAPDAPVHDYAGNGQRNADGAGAATAALGAAIHVDSAATSVRRVVMLKSHPAAAEVFQDGAELGVTPLDVSMNPGSTLTVQLRKRGFAEHTLSLHAEDRARVIVLKPLKDKAERAEKATAQKRRDRARSNVSASQVSDAAGVPSPAAASVGQGSPYEKF